MQTLERPPAKLRAPGLPGWLPWLARGHQHVSIWKKLLDKSTVLTIAGTAASTIFSVDTLLRGRRESPGGRMEAAVRTMTQPFVPTLQKVAEREIVVTITKRIDTWSGHATIIAGRYGSGKTVALEEALRDRQGVFVHRVKDADWEEQLFKRLGLDGPDMFEEVLRRVGGKLQRPPILVLDIPRSAKRGGGR